MEVPIYCINLRRSRLRRQLMITEFERMGLEAKFVRAVDGPAVLDCDRLIADDTLHPDHQGLAGAMSLAEIGCYLSHDKTWRLMRKRAASACALVCEDDIVFGQPLLSPADLASVLPPDCDLAYLHYLNPDGTGLTAPAFDPKAATPVAAVGGYRIYSAWSCGGTQCYMVTAAGLAKILAASRPIRHPVDGYLARLAYERHLTVYAVHPMPVTSRALPSTIW